MNKPLLSWPQHQTHRGENFAYLQKCLPDTQPLWPPSCRGEVGGGGLSSGGSKANSQAADLGETGLLLPVLTRHGASLQKAPHCPLGEPWPLHTSLRWQVQAGPESSATQEQVFGVVGGTWSFSLPQLPLAG